MAAADNVDQVYNQVPMSLKMVRELREIPGLVEFLVELKGGFGKNEYSRIKLLASKPSKPGIR